MIETSMDDSTFVIQIDPQSGHGSTDSSMTLESLQWKPLTHTSQTCYLNWLKSLQKYMRSLFRRHYKRLSRTLLVVMLAGYLVYLWFVFTGTKEGATLLMVLTLVGVVLGVYEVVKVKISRKVMVLLKPCCYGIQRVWVKAKWLVCPLALTALAVYLAAVVVSSQEQVCALLGYGIFVSLTLITSKHVTQIQWQPVVVGLGLQVALAVLFLRWGATYRAGLWLIDQVTAFLKHSLRGATTVFGNPTAFFHPLLMVVCPVILFVGGTMAILSHIGVTTYVIKKLSWLCWLMFGISRIEAQILAEGFFSPTMEHVVVFRHWVSRLTPSEMQTTMITSHSNLNAFMYAVFSLIWVEPNDLLLGAFIGVPAGIALSKMNSPEVHCTHFTSWKCIMSKRKKMKGNICEQTALGAWNAGKVTASIIIQVTAFMSMYELFDFILTWLGEQASICLNFKEIFSRVFMPFAYLLGIPSAEVHTCAYVLGLSFSQIEILAYLELGTRKMANAITRRTAAVTTVAVCGFSSFTSMILVIGGWSATSPVTYRRAIKSLWRVYFITKLSALSTACLFGVFFDETLIAQFEQDRSDAWLDLGRIISSIPSYKQLLPWLGIDV